MYVALYQTSNYHFFLLTKFKDIQIVRSFGQILIYATKSVVLRNDDDDVSMLPDILKGHCLHEKIRDPHSQQQETYKLIECERKLDSRKEEL